MSGRIEVNRSLPPVVMPARALLRMQEHARESHPEECCGLVLGSATGRYEDVHRCRNEMTRLHHEDPLTYPRDGRQAFHMNEADYLEAVKTAEERGLGVVAVYHSHADAGAYLSEMDQDYALAPGFPFPDADHIVISVVEGLVRETACFRRELPGGAFVGRLLVSEGP